MRPSKNKSHSKLKKKSAKSKRRDKRSVSHSQIKVSAPTKLSAFKQADSPRLVTYNSKHSTWIVLLFSGIALLSVLIVIIAFRETDKLMSQDTYMNDEQELMNSLASSTSLSNQIKTPTSSPDIILPKGTIPAEITRGKTTEDQIIFTFDGGSVDISGSKILDALESRGLKGTFFLTGDFIAKYPDVVRRMVKNGHEIYNHTYSHPYLTQASEEEIVSELGRTEKALIDLVGVSSKPFFRTPYGDRDARVLRIAAGEGYRSVYWSYDASDWRESEGETREEVRTKILSNVYPGAIVLMHMGDTISGDILGGVIDEIHRKGYRVVSLTEGL